jgi:hypothetical protein
MEIALPVQQSERNLENNLPSWQQKIEAYEQHED